ncbi:hypothetical protein A2230_07945 [candidate division WOR-1 bacterium RIFOXYA2_FULL_36_21]|nr:MAG: hypothetical protein A2230_07945 [candidate division WOR-1 bacterium RIFOXYA2_FULL_36_21]OGC16561.1 MAG: hypothetical protein A2282_06360 [candidate division WOR-1 bacterium RIFOXYA12_FULL_36_13]
MENVVPVEIIEKRIYLIRGQKVMLDKDLAELYGVRTFVLNQAIKRNVERFPSDFMFFLTREEILRISQTVISSKNIKFSKNVNVFTENGIAMLSSVLNSQQAIQVNITIMRTFTKLRALMEGNKALAEKLKELESKVGTNTYDIKLIFETIKQMLAVPEKPKRKMGFLA